MSTTAQRITLRLSRRSSRCEPQPTRHNVRDANEPAILRVLKQMSVEWIEAGPLDGWIYIGQWIPVEIKNPEGRNRLQRGQKEFIENCQALGRPHMVWRGVSDAIADVSTTREHVRRYGTLTPEPIKDIQHG